MDASGIHGIRRAYIPSNSKADAAVHITSTELRNCTGERKPCCHFTQTLHHGPNGNTCGGITEQQGQRARLGKGSANTQEQTGPDCTTKRDELNMSRFESVNVSSDTVLLPYLTFHAALTLD